jgi:phosphopantetheinyl transferase
MPLFYQHQINETTRLGIWKIAEAEDFFLKRVPLKRDVSHPHKRLQHLAGRYLLPTLFEDFPLHEILIADTRKPFLQNEEYHFSISHCGNFAAAIISSTNRVGVDIELVTPKIEKIKHKFLSEEEWKRATHNNPGFNFQSLTLDSELPTPNSLLQTPDSRLLTILWSCKEAIFKWYGNGEVDFKKHMQLQQIHNTNDQQTAHASFLFLKNSNTKLQVTTRFFDNLGLAFVHSKV